MFFYKGFDDMSLRHLLEVLPQAISKMSFGIFFWKMSLLLHRFLCQKFWIQKGILYGWKLVEKLPVPPESKDHGDLIFLH